MFNIILCPGASNIAPCDLNAPLFGNKYSTNLQVHSLHVGNELRSEQGTPVVCCGVFTLELNRFYLTDHSVLTTSCSLLGYKYTEEPFKVLAFV